MGRNDTTVGRWTVATVTLDVVMRVGNRGGLRSAM